MWVLDSEDFWAFGLQGPMCALLTLGKEVAVSRYLLLSKDIKARSLTIPPTSLQTGYSEF